MGDAQAVEVFDPDAVGHELRRLHEVNAVEALAETSALVRLYLP